jgi:hypothetical protein
MYRGRITIQRQAKERFVILLTEQTGTKNSAVQPSLSLAVWVRENSFKRETICLLVGEPFNRVLFWLDGALLPTGVAA